MKIFFRAACGAIVIGLLMISSTTAVPKINSDPLITIIDEMEKTKTMLEESLSGKNLDAKSGDSINFVIKKMKDTMYRITPDFGTKGLIDLLIKIIQWIISIIRNLITLVYKLIDLVDIISTLVNLIGNLIELIIELINLIIDIFTPKTVTST